MAIPTIINNILSIEEGNTRTLSLNNLNATAEGATTADILITIVPDSDTSLAGQFLLNDAPTLSFTLAQVETGQVEFAHDNSNFTPSYSVIASNNGDQSDAQQALVFFDAVNDAPTIDTKELTITEGGTVVFNLDMANLLATDEPGESTPAELTYGITKVTNGTFQRLVDGGTVDLGVSDAAFTQADIDNNLIQFVHDGSEQAPTIELRIVDSGLPMSDDDPPGRLIDLAPIGQTFDVDIEFFPINDAPKITVNEISLFEGDIVPITVENLAATDVEEDDATLTFTITAISQGRFELLDAPEGNVVQVLAAPGQESVGFTQAQVTAGLIQFVNDPATETEPSYTVVVKDSGQLTATDDPNPDLVEASEPSEAKVDYTTVNDTPIVVLPDSENPTLIDLMEQSQVTLTAADLFVKDEESDASNLTYTVKDLGDTPAGQFVRLDSGGGDPTPVTTFTQADIDAEAIAFDYFGVTEAPSFLLTVTDEGGKDVEIASSEIFNFLPENAAPEVENLALIVDEGAIIPITADNLLYTDEESAASDLTYTVTINNIDPDNPQDTDDRFIINGAVEVGATVTFTQQQINDGEVVFVHGGSNDAPDLTVTLTDTAVGGDANTIDVPLSDFITFNAENDLPILETFAFTLSEGDTVELTSDVLFVKDEEAAAAEITYTVDAVTGGNFFRLPTDPGGDPTLADTFTQAEIDAGDVLIFKHDGLNDGPTFTLTVSDGTAEIEVTDQSGLGVNYTPINDDPTVAANSFTVPEGDPNNPVPITLTAENLLVEDEESAPEDLTYTITITNNDEDNPDRFQIDGVIEVGETVTFTQADVNAGLVKFIHGGSNSIATLTATVKDTFPEEFGEPITIDVPLTVGFDAVNDAPIVENNIILEINEGGIEPLGADNLLTTDEETAAEDLVYTITGVNNGTFERVDLDQGTSTTILVGETFTQAEINAGEIRFVHDGGEDAPTYELSVVDTPLEMGGEVTSVPIASNIIKFNNLNDDPTLKVNQLTIKEGEEITFDAENIVVSDPDHDLSELRFNITDVKGGTFTFRGEALTDITNFTFADILFGELKFQDDGDETPPSYDVTVLDPLGGNDKTAADVTLIEENDDPTLPVNTFTIKEGERLVLNDEIVNLQASDIETPADELIFTFTDINGGAFFDANAQEIPAGTEITQALLNTGAISFLQDGSSPVPSFTITVKDADGGEVPFAANVDFIPVNDEPTVTSNPFAVTEGNPFTLTTAELLTVDDPGESGPAELTYTVILTNNDEDQPDGFRIGDGELQTESVTFTQEDVNEGRVTFVHGGSNTIATLTATVKDTFPEEFGEPFELPVELTATLNATNDSLVVENKGFETLDEGDVVTLGPDTLLTTDEETPPEGLTYTVISATNSKFQRLDAGGMATEIAPDGTFTQAEVNAGTIQFVHDGSEDAPTFSLKVEDEPLTPDDEATSETFDGVIGKFNNLNDAPTFDFNTLTVQEGAEVALTAENLSASDVDNLPSDLRFSITAVNGGEFFLKGEALALNKTFTAAAIAFEELTFKDDGDEEAATYTVKVEDGAGGETEESITVILDKVNDDPVIETNTFTITEGDRLVLNDPDTGTVNLAATDQETPADDLQFFVSKVEGGSFFDFAANPIGENDSFTQDDLNNGRISFVHDDSETVPTFDITVKDADGGEITVAGNVVQFIPINDPPTLDTVQLTVTEDAATLLTPADIVITDTDTLPEDLTITISALEGGTFNRLADGVVVEEGILTFTQAELIAGEVEFVDDGDQIEPSFSVTVNDGEFGSATLPVDILDFINTNDDPVAVPDSGTGFETDENTAFITASVVANDTDEDPGDAANLEVIEIEGQAVGVGDIELASGAIVSFADNGTINYDPNGKFQLPLGESTEDSFTYTVKDGNGGTDTSTVTVTINGVNDAPIAVDDKGEGFSTLDNESFTMTPLINDEDPDGDDFRIIKINGATVNPGETVPTDSATAVLNDDGSITYTPAEAFRLASVGETIPDSFTYTITDDNGGESTATVNIVINGANEAPVAVDDLGFTTVEGTNLLLEVLLNDTDIDFNDGKSISSVDTTGLLGSVVNNGDSLTYITPLSLRGDETALETFTYTMTDGIAVSESATVQVLVTGVNDAPIAVADSGTGFTTNEATAFTTANVLANDSDPEGATLSLVGLDTSGTQGLVTNNGDGTFNYDPNGVFNTLAQGRTATDTFSYTVSDDLGLTTTTTVTIGITGLLSEFVDFEQQLQRQNQAAIVPGDTVGFLPLAQLYDESFYLAQNPDVAGLVTAGVLGSGYEHFVAFGINEGRNPSVLYNESFYLNQNPDIAGAVASGFLASGLSHFLNFGHLEGRDPSAFFDESDYLLNNPDVALGVAQGSLASGFQHYILLGADEGRGPNLSLFDEAFYLANNPDVVGIDAYAHFTLFGQFEGRQPSALYNEASYLSIHGDIANAVNTGAIANGFQHYEAFGRFEGREVFA